MVGRLPAPGHPHFGAQRDPRQRRRLAAAAAGDAGRPPRPRRRDSAHGYASVDEEFEPGLVGVSAPVYGFRGDIIAAINVSAPKQRLGAHLDEAGKFTRSIADQMSTALGAP